MSKTGRYEQLLFIIRKQRGGIRFDDLALNIDWGVPKDKLVLIPKDLALPTFAECKNNFVYREGENIPA